MIGYNLFNECYILVVIWFSDILISLVILYIYLNIKIVVIYNVYKFIKKTTLGRNFYVRTLFKLHG